MSRLDVALIGAGRIAQTWADALESSTTCRLSAVCDVDLDAARAVAGEDRPAFETHRELLAAARPDALIIATPPVTHDAIAIDAARASVHVLCEKPFATDSLRARAMLEAARQSGTVLSMASKFRFVEDVREARRRLEQGQIGDLLLFENTFAATVDMTRRWNSQPEISGGGVLMDNGTHSLDLFRYFAGSPSSIHALEGCRPQGLDVEETIQISLQTHEGLRGNIFLSWSIDKSGTDLLALYGTQGRIHVGWQGSRAFVDGAWVDFGSGYDKLSAFQGQLDDFASAIRLGTVLRVGPDAALGSVAAVEAAYRALRSSPIWVDVDRRSEQILAV